LAQAQPLAQLKVLILCSCVSRMWPGCEIDECFAEGFGGTVRDTLDRSYWPDADTAAARMYPDCSPS
jgi:hypothetical protein